MSVIFGPITDFLRWIFPWIVPPPPRPTTIFGGPGPLARVLEQTTRNIVGTKVSIPKIEIDIRALGEFLRFFLIRVVPIAILLPLTVSVIFPIVMPKKEEL
jgi:hypothetical protein